MPVKKQDEVVRTHLEDLQSELEAGARQLTTIADSAAAMRSRLVAKHLQQAHLAGKLINEISELQRCVQEQRDALADLREAIRNRNG